MVKTLVVIVFPPFNGLYLRLLWGEVCGSLTDPFLSFPLGLLPMAEEVEFLLLLTEQLCVSCAILS